jgi:hypothetical protein
MRSTNDTIFSSTYWTLDIFLDRPLWRKMHILSTFDTSKHMKCTRWSSETFTTARPTSGVCALGISTFKTVPSDQDGPLKKKFSSEIRVLRIGFLPKYATVCRLSLWSWKAHLWSTTSCKNQPGPSGNGMHQRSSLKAPVGYICLRQDSIVWFQNSFQLSDLAYFGRRTQWAYAPISISNFPSWTME